MNRETALVLNHLKNSGIKYLFNSFTSQELRQHVVDIAPKDSFNAVWHNLIDESLNRVDWDAVLHYFNNQDYIDNFRKH